MVKNTIIFKSGEKISFLDSEEFKAPANGDRIITVYDTIKRKFVSFSTDNIKSISIKEEK